MPEHPSLVRRLEEYRTHLARDLMTGFDRHAEAAAVLAAVPALDGPVLDVGVGRGTLAIAAARRGLDVVGIDPDPDALEIAAVLVAEAGLADRVRLVRADAGDAPFEDGAFGAVVSLNALHHMDEHSPVLPTLARLVRPGGLVVLADFTEAGFARIAPLFRADHGHEHPVGPVTVDRAVAELETLGLVSVVRVGTRWERVAVLRRPA